MAKAKAEITVYHNVDITAVYRYYLLQSSTSAAPSKPTVYPPASTWVLAEPGYTEGSTNSLYTVECTLFSDSTFSYSEVSLSSSYEAAKEAYNKSVTAQETADDALEQSEDNITRIRSLETQADGITATVADIKVVQDSNSSAINDLNSNISVLAESVTTKMDANSVDIAITSALSNGVSSVTTTTGFTLNEDGLTISKTGSEMTTTIDEDGMEVKRGADTQLKADGDGVTAYDLHAKSYLIVGENSRFEDYNKNGKKQTGCFWVGSTEVE